MENLDLIYNDAFFKEWGKEHDKYIRSAKIINDTLYDLFTPKTVADLGCDCGIYSHLFKNKGVSIFALENILKNYPKA